MAEKKKSSTSTNKSKRKTTTKVSSKKVVSKSPSKKTVKKNTKKFDSLNLLKVVFYLLIIVVVVLSVVVIKKKQELGDNVKANIVIPIVNKEDEAPFSISLRALDEMGEYVFKVANYDNTGINAEDISYFIDVQNNTDTKVELTKYGSNKNLLNDQTQVTIDGGKVTKDEKKEDIYVVKITTPGKLTKDDFLNVKIRAVK